MFIFTLLYGLSKGFEALQKSVNKLISSLRPGSARKGLTKWQGTLAPDGLNSQIYTEKHHLSHGVSQTWELKFKVGLDYEQILTKISVVLLGR